MPAAIPNPDQTELPLKMKTERTPDEVQADGARLVALLADGARMTAAEICKALDFPMTEDGKRYVRKLGEICGGVLSFPGSDGYLLKKFAKRADYERSANAWLAQAKTMTKRGMADLRMVALMKATEQAMAPKLGHLPPVAECALDDEELARALAQYLAGEDQW